MACECLQYVCENDIRIPGVRRFRQSLDPVTGVPFGKVQIIEGSISECELNQTDGGCIDRKTHAFRKKSRYSFQVWNQRQGV